MNAIISTGKSLLNALAFANVNNIDELRSMLDQNDAPAAAQGDAPPAAPSQPCFSPAVKHVQGAL